MPRRKPEPAKRLDWRDPSMSALREYEITNDLTGDVVARGVELVPPDVITEIAQADLECSGDLDWRDDPSYGWGKDRQRKGRRALR